jgi:methionine--tRNA ligase beta chain
MIKNWKKFNEGTWDDFKNKWKEVNPDILPTYRDLPFKVGDNTNKGKIRLIDKPYFDGDDLADLLIGIDTNDYSNRWVRASEIEVIKDIPVRKDDDLVDSEVSDLKAEIDFSTVMSLDIRACKVIDAERVPKKDRLIVLKVETEFDERQVVTNLGQDYDVEDFKGKIMWFILNLKPAKIAGIISEGMIVISTIDNKPKLVYADVKNSKLLP